MPRSLFGAVFSVILALTVAAIHAEPVKGTYGETDPETGLARWHFRDGALSVELVQRLPDQTRAFFMGRGFSADSADRIALACVFQAIVRNDAKPRSGGPALAIDLARWRVDHGSGSQPLPLETDWQMRWEAAAEPQSARIAFRWAMFPTEQVFQPGDYNWGMVALGARPGTDVDVELFWREGPRERHGRLGGIRCHTDGQADQ